MTNQFRCFCCEQDTLHSLGRDVPDLGGWICIWCMPCPHCGSFESDCDPDAYWRNCPEFPY